MTGNNHGLAEPYFHITDMDQMRADIIAPFRALPGESRFRLQPRVARSSKVLGALTIGLAVFMGESFATQYEMSQTHSYTIPVEQAADTAQGDTEVLIAGGFAQRSGYVFASALSGFTTEGTVRALVYKNGEISANEISGTLQHEIKDRDPKKLILWGASMGGIVLLEAAADIRESDKTDAYAEYIVLEDTPSSIDAVRPELTRDGQMLLAYSGSELLANSRVARTVLEMSMRMEEFADKGFSLPWLFKTTTRTWDRLHTPSASSAQLMGAQYSIIVGADVRENIMRLGAEVDTGKPSPVLVLVRPVSDRSDRVVYSDYIEEQYRTFAQEAGLRLIIVRGDGIVHGDPSKTKEMFAEMIPQIVEQVARTQANPLVVASQDEFLGRTRLAPLIV